MAEARQPARRTTTPRATTTRKSTTRKTTSTRKTTTRRRTTTPRRRTSTASTLGTAVGVALAGIVATTLGGLPWWGWVLLIVAGLLVGLGYAVVKARRAPTDADPADPAPQEPTGP